MAAGITTSDEKRMLTPSGEEPSSDITPTTEADGPTMTGETRNEISGGVFFSAVVQGRDITVQLPPEVPTALSGLPAASAAFVGRDAELAEMLVLLRQPAPGAVVVSGGPAVGKTELAVQAARAALGHGWFPGGVFFADLHGYDPERTVAAGPALDGFLSALGVPAQSMPAPLADRSRLLRSVLATYAEQGRAVLVVLDNVAGAEQVLPLLAGDTATATIVTSRHRLSMLDGATLELSALGPDDAVDLLDRALQLLRPGDARVGTDRAHAVELASQCGFLPLALRIVAAMLADDPARSLPVLSDELGHAINLIDRIEHSDTSLRAALDLSLRSLGPDQSRMFRLLPLNPGAELSIEAASILSGLDEHTCRRVLEDLARAHMLEPGARYGRWHLSDFQRLYASAVGARTQLTPADAAGFRALLSHYLNTAHLAAASLNHITSGPASSRFTGYDDALAWLDIEYDNLAHFIDTVARFDWHAQVCAMASKIAGYLVVRCRFEELARVSSIAVNAAVTMADTNLEAAARNNLALAALSLGDLDEAAANASRAAALFDDDSGRAQALGNLAAVYTARGQYEEALELHRRSATIFRQLDRTYDEAVTHAAMGQTLLGLGRFHEAQGELLNALDTFREIGNRFYAGAVLSDLGRAFFGEGKFDVAATSYHMAADVLRSDRNEHLAARAVRGLEEAETATRFATEVGELARTRGPDHPETYETLYAFAEFLRACKAPQLAVVVFEECVSAVQAIAGPADARTAGARMNLAFVYEEHGDHARAREQLELAARIARSHLAADHPVAVVIEENLRRFWARQVPEPEPS